MTSNYWRNVLEKRLTRRRAIVTTGAGAFGAAFLAACGGSDSGEKVDLNTLIAPFQETTKQAKSGGIWQGHMARSSITFDPLTGTTADLAHAAHVYQRLLRQKVGTVFDRPEGTVEGDAASSYEISPDKLTVTLKLRPNNKLDPRGPTNGRTVTTEDIKYSFDKFSQLSPNRGNVLNSVSPDLPITSLTTPDSSTVVIKMAFPDSSILSMLAWGWFLNVVPVEADGKFDSRQEMRGSGPWMLTEFTPSASWSYRRNPNWFQASEGRPYLDGIDYALISEPATVEAQFKAKRLWSTNAPGATAGPNPDNVLTMKRENPDALMFQTSPKGGNGGYRLLSPSKLANSPLNDVRVLHAASMLLDRDLLIDVFGNVENFAKEGVQLEKAWHSHTPASWSSIWLDPQGKGLGDDAKWFKHDPAEAAKLMRAADKFGLEQEFAMWTPIDAGWQRQAEVIQGMMQEGGAFKLKQVVSDYNSHYQPTYNRSNNQFQGFAGYQIFSGLPDWNMVTWNHTNPGARNDYISSFDSVPGLRDVMVKRREEIDENKRTALAHEWQKLMAKYMPYVPYSMPGGAGFFTFAWPWFGNYGVHQTYGTSTQPADTYPYLWYDKAKDTRGS